MSNPEQELGKLTPEELGAAFRQDAEEFLAGYTEEGQADEEENPVDDSVQKDHQLYDGTDPDDEEPVVTGLMQFPYPKREYLVLADSTIEGIIAALRAKESPAAKEYTVDRYSLEEDLISGGHIISPGYHEERVVPEPRPKEPGYAPYEIKPLLSRSADHSDGADRLLPLIEYEENARPPRELFNKLSDVEPVQKEWWPRQHELMHPETLGHGRDPFHGAEARERLRNIPPMPLEDGTFYVPGAFETTGTCYFDAEGRPFFRPTAPTSTVKMLHEVKSHAEWAIACENGELPDEIEYPEFQFDATPYLAEAPEEPTAE